MYCIVFCIIIHSTKYSNLIQFLNKWEYKKMAITTEQIHATADQLAQQGIKPTQTNVREALGGGSFTTIAEALRTWRQEQETVTQLQAVVIPQDITDRTQTLTAQIWETAQAIANERLAKEREALAHKEALLIGENDEMQKVVATLENEQAELTAQLDTLNNDNSLLTHKNNELENLTNSLKTQLTAEKDRADQATATAQQLQAKLDEQTAKIERLTADLATAQANANQATETAKEHAQRADKATVELQNTHIENAKLIGTADTLKEQLTKYEATTTTQAEKINLLTAQLARLEQIEKENAELKRMIESNKKIDEKQQSLLDQPPMPQKTRSKTQNSE